MKVAVLGGGGFRAPGVWASLSAVAHDASIDEIVLQDASAARLERIAAVIEGLRREADGAGVPIRATTRLDDALDGCGAALCAIRVGGLEGRVIDEAVPLRLGVLGQETVGPGGIAFALRTVPVMRAIAEATARVAPDAWFLNLTNPAGLVTESIRPILGDRAVGICDSPASLCARAEAALGRPPGSVRFDYAGLNHLGWLRAAYDAYGEDLLPALLSDEGRLASLEEARLIGTDDIRRVGLIPNEYLLYYERCSEIVDAIRKAGVTRATVLLSQQSRFFAHRDASPEEALARWRATRSERYGTYMAEERGAVHAKTQIEDEHTETSEGLAQEGYAAIAASFLRAAARGAPETLILDVANRGRLDFLDDDAVVEVSCLVGVSGPAPLPGGTLPSRQRALVERVKHVERLTIRAAEERSAELALEAIASHPLVPSRDLAERIFSGYLEGHPDLRRLLG